MREDVQAGLPIQVGQDHAQRDQSGDASAGGICWSRLIPFFDYPPKIRKVIYTTNAIGPVNMSLRKLTKNRGSFPSDEALLKLFCLALRNFSLKWSMPFHDWRAAFTRLTIEFGESLSDL